MTFIDEILENELKKPSIFRDESIFNQSHLPTSLPFREGQFRQLIQHFRSLLTEESPSHNHIILHGPVGVGKTTTMRLFGRKALKRSKLSSKNHLRYVHLNCRRYRRSSYQALKAILIDIWGPMSPRGYSISELMEMLEKILKKNGLHLLVVLDEAEYLLQHDTDLLNYLIRLEDSFPEADVGLRRKNFGVSVALIVRHQHLENILDSATMSSLKQNFIYFPPYTKYQLVDILRDRVKEGFKSGTVPERILEMIAEIAAMRGGDCRLALELLYRSGKMTDEESLSVITNEMVRKAAVGVYQVEKRLIHSLGKEKKIILYFLVMSLKNQIDFSEPHSLETLWEKYKGNNAIKQLKRMKKKEFIRHVLELSKMGLLSCDVLNEGDEAAVLVRLPLDLPLTELEWELSKNSGENEISDSFIN